MMDLSFLYLHKRSYYIYFHLQIEGGERSLMEGKEAYRRAASRAASHTSGFSALFFWIINFQGSSNYGPRVWLLGGMTPLLHSLGRYVL
jgi:hypothetical protein